MPWPTFTELSFHVMDGVFFADLVVPNFIGILRRKELGVGFLVIVFAVFFLKIARSRLILDSSVSYSLFFFILGQSSPLKRNLCLYVP